MNSNERVELAAAAPGANDKSDVLYKLGPIRITKKVIIGAVVILLILLIVLPILKSQGIIGNEGFAGPFSLWGTPDWKIRNKGHMHQERSDSHVSKSKKTRSLKTSTGNKSWSLTAFKKSVRELNKKANE